MEALINQRFLLFIILYFRGFKGAKPQGLIRPSLFIKEPFPFWGVQGGEAPLRIIHLDKKSEFPNIKELGIQGLEVVSWD